MSISRDGRSTSSLIRSMRLVPPAMNLAAGSAAIWRTASATRLRAHVLEIDHDAFHSGRPFAPHRLLDGGDDVGIGAAAADVAAHQLADLVGGLRLSLRDHADRGADLARGAVAALKRVVLDERLLQRMQRSSLRQPLDRRDLSAVLHDRERQAGIDPPTVDQHRAGAALPVVAALLCSGQAETIAERVEQRCPRRNQLFRCSPLTCSVTLIRSGTGIPRAWLRAAGALCAIMILRACGRPPRSKRQPDERDRVRGGEQGLPHQYLRSRRVPRPMEPYRASKRILQQYQTSKFADYPYVPLCNIRPAAATRQRGCARAG